VRRVAFRVAAEDKEALLDALLPLLPGGVREAADTDGHVRLSALGGAGALPPRAVLERAAGRPLDGWAEDEVPADWRARRAVLGEGGVLVRDRVLIRSPWDPAPGPGLVDVVVERRGGAFGSGSHPTTQMCVALLLDLAPEGGAADLGCGIGTLAIAAARLGWAPVTAVDRVPVAIEVARENVIRNGVEVACAVADLASDPVPLAPLLLVNAPPPVHERVAAALSDEVAHVIVSGIVAGEAEAVLGRYRAAGFAPAEALGTEDEWLAIRLARDDG
jgi:ribosomal protein L11 methyltransferase